MIAVNILMVHGRISPRSRLLTHSLVQRSMQQSKQDDRYLVGGTYKRELIGRRRAPVIDRRGALVAQTRYHIILHEGLHSVTRDSCLVNRKLLPARSCQSAIVQVARFARLGCHHRMRIIN